MLIFYAKFLAPVSQFYFASVSHTPNNTAQHLQNMCTRKCHRLAVSVKRIPPGVLYSLSFLLYVAELVELMLVISRQLLVVIMTLLLLLAMFAVQIRQDIIQPSCTETTITTQHWVAITPMCPQQQWGIHRGAIGP